MRLSCWQRIWLIRVGPLVLTALLVAGCAGASRSVQTATAPAASAPAATVSGVVVSNDGKGIPGATVVLVDNTSGRRSTPIVTAAQGDYVLLNVPAGKYKLQATLSGFTPAQQVVQVTGGQVAGPTMVLVAGVRSSIIPIPLAR